MSTSSSAEASGWPVYDLSGRRVVVTGAGGGLGAPLVTQLRAAGATVWSWDLEPEQSDDERAVAVDVTDGDSVAAAVASVAARDGGIDVLVNNAGLSGPTEPLVDYDPALWRRVLDVNLVGVYEVSRQLVPLLERGRAPRMVNVASLAGKEGTPNASAYSAAKAGVIALTKSLGKELVDRGVLVNAVAPAAIATPLLAQMTETHVDTMVAKSPIGRLGTPDELVELVLWLASPACSFSTGAVFDLSGGRATY